MIVEIESVSVNNNIIDSVIFKSLCFHWFQLITLLAVYFIFHTTIYTLLSISVTLFSWFWGPSKHTCGESKLYGS